MLNFHWIDFNKFILHVSKLPIIAILFAVL